MYLKTGQVTLGSQHGPYNPQPVQPATLLPRDLLERVKAAAEAARVTPESEQGRDKDK